MPAAEWSSPSLCPGQVGSPWPQVAGAPGPACWSDSDTQRWISPPPFSCPWPCAEEAEFRGSTLDGSSKATGGGGGQGGEARAAEQEEAKAPIGTRGGRWPGRDQVRDRRRSHPLSRAAGLCF